MEVDTIDQLREALDAGVDMVLLDNMSLPTLSTAVDPEAMFTVTKNPEMEPLADQVRTALKEALDRLSGDA